jgi:hypothetical protein
LLALAAAGCGLPRNDRPPHGNNGGAGAGTGEAVANSGGKTGGGDPQASVQAGKTGSSGETGGGSGSGGTTGGSGSGGSGMGAAGTGGSGAGGSAMDHPDAGGTGGSAGSASGGTGGMAPPGVEPTGAAWGRAELCSDYCNCMGSGKCTGKAPANCAATCKSNANNWNIPCRLEKCKSANKDYSDQISGSCASAAGAQGCWDKDVLTKP